MLEKDDGIVLRTARSGETSLQVGFLGRRAGKIRLMAKGALGSKPSARGLLEPGNHLEIVYYFKEGRTLFFLREASLVAPAAGSRDSLEVMAVRLAAVELLDQVCYPGSADEGVVAVAAAFLDGPVPTDPLVYFLAFELALLGALGAIPDLARCGQCGRELDTGVYDARAGASFCRAHASGGGESITLTAPLLEGISGLMHGTLAEAATCRLDARVRKALGKLLHWTYTFHVQGYSLPKSLNLL
jgi:DNA repair protein RecO